MVAIQKQLAQHREEILAIAKRHGAKNVRVFGSFARGDATEFSDVDFLVDFERGRSLIDQAGLGLDLEGLLGRKVDVVTVAGLHPSISGQILAEARPL